MIRFLAAMASNILHPLLMPLFGMLILLTKTWLFVLPVQYKLILLGMIFLFTCVIPIAVIMILYKLKVISDPALNIRSERPLPYLLTLLSYLACAILLSRSMLPLWGSSFVWGGLAALIISSIVNTKWKISAHMAGIGGVLGIIFAMGRISPMVTPWLIISAIIATGILGTSRVLLGRHTFGQVMAGTANGFLCTFIAFYLTQ